MKNFKHKTQENEKEDKINTRKEPTSKGGRGPKPPCWSLFGMSPRRYEPLSQDQYSSLKQKCHLEMANVNFFYVLIGYGRS